MSPKLLRAFWYQGARHFSEKDWLQHIYEVTRRGSSTARVPEIPSCSSRTKLMAPELMGHIAIPFNWKEIVFHRGCSFNLSSVLETGLMGRHTIFFTPLNPLGDNPDEEAQIDDFSRPRKVHYVSHWKTFSGRRLLDKNYPMHKIKDVRFGLTKSNAIIVHKSCAGWLHLQVNFTERGSNNIRKLPTPRLAPRLSLRSYWQVQQQHSQQQRQHSESVSSKVGELTRGTSVLFTAVPRSWRRKEVVWNSRYTPEGKMGLHSDSNGGTNQRNWTPSMHWHQCFESWNSEKKRWLMYCTHQCGFVEHTTLVSHNSLSKWAQYLVSSISLVWRVSSMDSDSKKSWPWRSPYQKETNSYKKCKAGRSEFFGTNSKGATMVHLKTYCEINFADLTQISSPTRCVKEV